MSRRPIDERSGPATETLTLRLTTDDRSLLDRLVGLRAAELADDGIEVTAASYVRGLIRRDAKVKGLLHEVKEAHVPPTPFAVAVPVEVAKARTAEPVESRDQGTPVVQAPRDRTLASTPDAGEVRAALVRALERGASQADLARRTGIDGGQLSGFKSGKRGLSPDSLGKLAAVVKV